MNTTDAYPLEHVERSDREFKRLSLAVAAVGIVALIFIYLAIFRDGLAQPAALAGAIFLFLLWVLYSVRKSPVKLALYLENKVPGDMVWSAPLARNCLHLDEIATDAGLPPFSSFGFAAEVIGEAVTWHDPHLGRAVIAALIQRLRAEPHLVTDSDSVIADLESMTERLGKAAENESRFAFILHGDGINLMEVEQRKGHF